jgi:hypothetical protein
LIHELKCAWKKIVRGNWNWNLWDSESDYIIIMNFNECEMFK